MPEPRRPTRRFPIAGLKLVTNALVAKGINKARLTSKGWGQTKPLADNTSETGSARNRRVEIVKR